MVSLKRLWYDWDWGVVSIQFSGCNKEADGALCPWNTVVARKLLLWGTGALFPGGVSSGTVGLGSNSQGRPVRKTQGLNGNAADDSIGRALPSVDVGAEPHRHIPP